MTGRLLRLAPAALAFSALLLTAPAAAQQPTPTSPDAAQVNQHYEAGLEAAKQSQWLQARESFLRAWRLRAHYQIAANLGRAELMTGAHRDAAEHLAYFLREAGAEVSAQDRAQAQQWLDEAKSKIGTVTIKVAPADAEVLLDGTRLPSPLPAEIFVEPGPHVFEVRRDGLRPERRELTAAAGQEERVTVRLAPGPVTSSPPASAPAPDRNRMLIGIGIGATFAATAEGVLLLMVAGQKAARLDDIEEKGYPQTRQEEWFELERSRATLLNAATWTFIGAGLLGGATAVYALTGGGSSGPARSGRIRVIPAGAGLGVVGSF